MNGNKELRFKVKDFNEKTLFHQNLKVEKKRFVDQTKPRFS